MSDNFHQSVNGGTGANHIMLGHGDMIWFSDGKGQRRHASAQRCWLRQAPPMPAVVDEIENPNPARQHQQLVYGRWLRRRLVWLAILRRRLLHGVLGYHPARRRTDREVSAAHSHRQINPHCQAGHYYLLNNYNPGYFGNGNNAYTDTNTNNTVFTIPPSSVRSIGDVTARRRIFRGNITAISGTTMSPTHTS